MKTSDLITYNRENTTNIRRGEARMRFNKTGAIALTRELMLLAELEEGDHIEFYQKKEEPEEWFFAKTKNQSGFTIRSANKNKSGNTTYMINSAYVSKTILKQIDAVNSVSLKVSETPIKAQNKNYWLIITSSAKS
ncbi:MAG: hypothetical protein ACOCYO_03930 [Bacteroidota bacterium]